MNGVYDGVSFFFYALNLFFLFLKRGKPNSSRLPLYVRYYLSVSESHTMLFRCSSSSMLYHLDIRPLIHP